MVSVIHKVASSVSVRSKPGASRFCITFAERVGCKFILQILVALQLETRERNSSVCKASNKETYATSLSRSICRLRFTTHGSPRFLHLVHGGVPSLGMAHRIFCLRQATHAVIFLLMSIGLRSPKDSRRACTADEPTSTGLVAVDIFHQDFNFWLRPAT